MRILISILLLLFMVACAGPNVQPEATEVPRAEREAPASPTAAESAAPVEPVPVIETTPEPEPEPEPAPEPPPPEPARPAPPEAGPAEPQERMDQEPSVAEPRPASDAAPPPTPDARPEGVNLTGRVSILRDGRPQDFPGLHLNQTVIAWRPDGPASVEAMDEQQIMTRRSRFFPQTMAVTSGTSVRFPNMDSIRHNVFSLSPGHQFDVGLYGEGDGRSQTFTGSGMVELYCNVHPNMAAFLLVLDTPYFVNPDEEGRFTLRGLPPGPGELLVWNYRAEEIFRRLPMNLSAVTEPLDIRVDITRPAVPQHSNKHGEAYNRDRARP